MNVYYDKIEEYRLKAGISIPKLSKKLGINRSTYWRWQKTNYQLSYENIQNLANILGISVSVISDLPPEPQKDPQRLGIVEDIWRDFSLFHAKNSTDVIKDMFSGLYRLNEDISNIMFIIKGLLTSSHISFYIKNTELKYIAANSEFLKVLSLGMDFIVLGKKDSDLFAKNDAELNTTQDMEVIRTGKPIIDFEQYTPGSRKKSWSIVSKIPIIDLDQKVSGLIGIFVDITARKKEERIRAQLESNLNVITEGIVIYTPDFECLYANKAALEMRGNISLDELRKINGTDRINKFIYEVDRKKIINAIKEKDWRKNEQIIVRFNKGNNEFDWIELNNTASTFLGKDCVFSIQKNISSRVKAEKKNMFLANCLNTFNDSVLIIDSSNKNIIYMNNSAEEVFKRENSKSSNFENLMVEPVHSQDRTLVSSLLNPTDSLTAKYRILKNGTYYWVETSSQRIEYQGQNFILFIQHDITDKLKSDELKNLLEILTLNAEIGIIIREKQNRKTIFRNKKVESITGYTVKEIDKLKIEDIYPAKYANEVTNFYHNKNSESTKIVSQYKTKSGNKIWVSSIMQTIKFNGVDCVATFMKEITGLHNSHVLFDKEKLTEKLKSKGLSATDISEIFEEKNTTSATFMQQLTF